MFFKCLLISATYAYSAYSIGCSDHEPSMAFSTEKVRTIGRFDYSATGVGQFNWPGSAIEFRFQGTKASIELSTQEPVRFLVEVNGHTSELWVKGNRKRYVLAKRLPEGEHHIRLTLLNESFGNVVAVHSIPKVNGELLEKPVALTKRILAIGDSITVGYGVEGESQHCQNSAKTSNVNLAYPALIAKKFNADLHTVAWSGIGVWRAYGETQPKKPTISMLNKRTLAGDFSTVWDVSAFKPNVILLGIGTNDFWQEAASIDSIEKNLRLFVKELSVQYDKPKIYLIASAMLSGDRRAQHINVLQALEDENVKVIDAGAIQATEGFGCDYHPNKITQQKMAIKIASNMQKDLGWKSGNAHKTERVSVTAP